MLWEKETDNYNKPNMFGTQTKNVWFVDGGIGIPPPGHAPPTPHPPIIDLNHQINIISYMSLISYSFKGKPTL